MHKILFSIVTTSLIMGSINAQQIKYPKARVMNASDEYFGTKVAEPYLGSKTTAAKKPRNGLPPKTR